MLIKRKRKRQRNNHDYITMKTKEKTNGIKHINEKRNKIKVSESKGNIPRQL